MFTNRKITVDWLEKNFENVVKNNQVIDGLRFVRTCIACPEQYDVFDEMGIICYVRFRHGRLRAEYPWIDGKKIVDEVVGDEYQGIFNDERDRAINIFKVIEAIKKEDINEQNTSSNYEDFREHFNKHFYDLDIYFSNRNNKITKEQIDKFNRLLGALICHGKGFGSNDYEESDMIDFYIEDLLYSIDSDYAKYLTVKQLYKRDETDQERKNVYVKTVNEYKSDVEVRFVDNDNTKDPCTTCTCASCQASHDRFCPGEDSVEQDVNCEKCINNKGNKTNFKHHCNGKYEAVKNWCLEINDRL